MTLSACKQAPLSPAPQITVRQCQPVTACTFPAMTPRTNGDLSDALDIAKAAWATCAARIDMIVKCQTEGSPGINRHD
ncbi:Rz1-like lysis system protein LysC [Paraburkholderia aspalathi]|uniref:Rz1-like lysis system protein LysC n=1 Tax=Paraburkholderia aspalathi TaxID=1324617 RepID=UPI001F1CF778|nr:Rz1-like lysis system protein LysC [Paraburkholderia aspalathi]